MKKKFCRLFKHWIRPHVFHGSDTYNGTITIVTMRSCWCRKHIHMKSETHHLAANSGS